ncbi:MAG: carboxypeptidase regulatory-like domain-containing protein [Methanocella sp.]
MKQRWIYGLSMPLALALAGAAMAASSGSAHVLSGGVGQGAREQLAEQAHGYGLKLVFTSEKGAYLADVPVQVTDAKGNVVVDAVSQGPWMFVDLPRGSYTVKASYDGKSESRKVTVGNSQKTVQFRWQEPGIQMAADRAR